jgi:CheY-like chemotaxis protein
VAQGHSVVVCANASTALAQAKTSKPDVVMLGIDLPDLSGYELLRQLHALPGGKDATYVAVAGFGQSHDKVITKAAGFEHQLVEPVSAASLQRILSPVK